MQITTLELQKEEEDDDEYAKLDEDFDKVHRDFNTVRNGVYKVLANYTANVKTAPAAAAPAPAAVAARQSSSTLSSLRT